MIKSMTGFGKGDSYGRSGRFTAELRTVNHRYFDVSSRMPNSFAILEDKIRNYIHKYIKRGKVNFSLTYRENGKSPSSIKLDEGKIEKYHKMLTGIKKKFKLSDDIRLSHILSFSDVIVREESQHDAGSEWPLVAIAVKQAIMDCSIMREKEGRALYKDLMKRIGKIVISLNGLSRLAPRLVSEYKTKLDSRIKDILKHRGCDIDKSRLETELAIFARQTDVSEEITRARSHLSALKNTLASNKEAGRRLDFILQELQREINTLGSKTGSVKISRLVVDIKSEIAKIREQAQNVE